ncbi:MAG TPA: S1 RNA-binding domain-containing protein, partial [Elusimicrobiales bacterium]|nr:S1 RNA-binding domain-containing protein [Elusimicrobiales bacterium]
MDINEKNDIPAEAGNGATSGPSGRPEEEISMEELMKSEGEAHKKIYSRDIVKVKVVQVTKDHVLVDIGEKKEAVIPVSDFQDEKLPGIGDEVSAVFERKGGEHTVLSHRKAREKAAVEWAKSMFEAKERVKARVAGVVKGGYIVDLAGLKAFMPLSLSELG